MSKPVHSDLAWVLLSYGEGADSLRILSRQKKKPAIAAAAKALVKALKEDI